MHINYKDLGAYAKPVDPYSDRSAYSYTLPVQHFVNAAMSYSCWPKKGCLMDKLRFGYCRASRAADDCVRNPDPEQQLPKAAGIRPGLSY